LKRRRNGVNSRMFRVARLNLQLGANDRTAERLGVARFDLQFTNALII